MLLSQDQQMVRDAVRDFVQAEILPKAAAWDKANTFPARELKGLAALGCYGIAVPEAWGGAGLDYRSLALVIEEIAAGDGATSTIVSVNNCPVCSILMSYANPAQKEQWLRPLAGGEMLGAFCLTEPHTGSDASALRTTATREGDSYVIHGVKQFITSGKHADVAIVMAVTDKTAGKKGISAFIVPTQTPGYVVARLEDKLGQHASDTAQILFEKARVTKLRSPVLRAGASALPRSRSVWPAPPLRPRCAIPKNARPLAKPFLPTKRCSFVSATWPRRSRRLASSFGMPRV
jgi:butyryl-CoA dehydrogenase